MASTLIELSARFAINARFPARLIDIPDGCLPTVTVLIKRGGLVVKSITYSLLSGAGFQPVPSCIQSIELATNASCPLGVMPKLVGGPKIEFIRGRLATIFGLAGLLPMSTIVTESFPGAENWILPSLPQVTLLSMPTTIYSGLPGTVLSMIAQAASVAAANSSANERSRFIMVPLLESSDAFVARVGIALLSVDAEHRTGRTGTCQHTDRIRPETPTMSLA